MQAWTATARRLLWVLLPWSVSGCADDDGACDVAPEMNGDVPIHGTTFCGPAPLVPGNQCVDPWSAVEAEFGPCREDGGHYDEVCTLGISDEGECCYVLKNVVC